MADSPPSHLVIPDTQVKPGVPMDHLGWIGAYALEKRPDTLVMLGDHWDMPSLSSYDKGKKSMEGRRFLADVAAGNEGFRVLNEPIDAYNKRMVKTDHRSRRYRPRKVKLRGNHEHRIMRAVEADAQLDGLLSYELLDTRDWEVHDFLKPVTVDGVVYCHYFQNRGTGKPLGGLAATRLKQLGHSFVQGHQQVLDVAVRYVLDRPQWGLICGAAYLHDEDYLGYQGNNHWRGVVMLHEVRDGAFDPMFISLDFLCRKYEGVPLEQFTARRFGGFDPKEIAA